MPTARPKTGELAQAWLAQELAEHPPERIFAPGREHIGDVVNLTGPLKALRERFPNAHITVEVGERTTDLLHGFPYVNEVWARPTRQGASGKVKHILRLKRAGFDLAVLLDDSNDLVLQAKLGGIPRRIGIWRGKKYEDLFDAYVPYQREIHEVRDHGSRIIQLLGGNTDPCLPCLFPSEADRQAARAVLESLSGPGPLIGIHPGSADPMKRWGIEPLAKTAALLISQGARVVLVGGPSDQSDLDSLQAMAGPRILRLKERLSILSFGFFLSGLDRLICMDSGPMHLCAALGGRVCALYGPTYLSHSSPAGEGHTLFHKACPCPERSSKTCTRACFEAITPEEVAGAALGGLGS